MTIRRPCCCSSGSSPGTSLDRLAPTIVVGNTLEGDSAVAYSQDGFVYVPDTGNGAGIATALGLLGANGGRVYIRRGDYNFNNVGGPAGPLTVPGSTTIQGEDIDSTTIVGRSAGAQGIFDLNSSCQVMDMTLASTVADPAGTGIAGLIRGRNLGTLQNLRLYVASATTSVLRAGISWTSSATSSEPVQMNNVHVSVLAKTGSATPSVGLLFAGSTYAGLSNIYVNGGDIGISGDRSFVFASNVQLRSWAVSGWKHTNSTGAAGGGRVVLTNAEIVGDGTAGQIGMDLGWYTHQISNTFVDGSSVTFGAVGIRQQQAVGGTQTFLSLYGVRIRNFDVGVQVGDVATAQQAVGVSIVGCYVQAGNRALSVYGTSGYVGARISSSYFATAKATADGVVRFEGPTSQGGFQLTGCTLISAGSGQPCLRVGIRGGEITGNLLVATTGAAPEAPVVFTASSCVFTGNRIDTGVAASAIRLVSVSDTVLGSNNINCDITPNGTSVISFEAATQCMMTGNIMQKVLGGLGVNLDATSQNNNVACNSLRAFGGGTFVADAGTNNNVGTGNMIF